MDQHIEAGAQANIDLVAPSWICRRPCAWQSRPWLAGFV